ncbi:hypothetical protein [Aeromicrobium sp. CFBP 8757]|nr:hypothetical protein [Aeromicrobium sp. CFBP 8757]
MTRAVLSPAHGRVFGDEVARPGEIARVVLVPSDAGPGTDD